MIQLIENARSHQQRIAIIANDQQYSYQQLLDLSGKIARVLLANQDDLDQARVAFMIKPGFYYVATQWAIWRAGGIAVPLSLSNPLPAQEYTISDADCAILIADQDFETLLSPVITSGHVRFLSTSNFDHLSTNTTPLPDIAPARSAMIIYTSGTTGKPKGVVTTHENINAQVATLVHAWHWSKNDRILNVLPLHHVHGVINVVSCALWSGACCRFIHKFDAAEVMQLLISGKLNVFMAVPTIYYKLIQYWSGLTPAQQEQIKSGLSQFRLMVSGSAALPVSVMEQWESLSNQRLLERYGMTEIGMAISNPYHGERRAGHIGQPLPGMQVRLVHESGIKVSDGQSGEIQVKGNAIFKEYWQRPEATQKAFTTDGWFKTGDVALLNEGSYRILGRMSVDIIKSGGYKISALEIEEVLRTHPKISDCAVIGIPDPEWDEIIAAGLVINGSSIDLKQLNHWLKERLPVYKIPRRYLVLQDLPRNAMGKVTKQALKKQFQPK